MLVAALPSMPTPWPMKIWSSKMLYSEVTSIEMMPGAGKVNDPLALFLHPQRTYFVVFHRAGDGIPLIDYPLVFVLLLVAYYCKIIQISVYLISRQKATWALYAAHNELPAAGTAAGSSIFALSGGSALDNGHLQHNMMAGFTPRQHIQQSACRHNTGHRDHCIQRGQARTADLTIRGIIFSHQRNLLGYLHAALFQDVQKADCYQIIGTDDAVNFGVLLQQCPASFSPASTVVGIPA